MTQASALGSVSETRVNRFVAQVYLLMALGLVVTAVIKEMGRQLDSHPAKGGLAVLGALKLYLDFINLFLLLLRASRR